MCYLWEITGICDMETYWCAHGRRIVRSKMEGICTNCFLLQHAFEDRSSPSPFSACAIGSKHCLCVCVFLWFKPIMRNAWVMKDICDELLCVIVVDCKYLKKNILLQMLYFNRQQSTDKKKHYQQPLINDCCMWWWQKSYMSKLFFIFFVIPPLIILLCALILQLPVGVDIASDLFMNIPKLFVLT